MAFVAEVRTLGLQQENDARKYREHVGQIENGGSSQAAVARTSTD